eukprot:1160224-Pelagomonas_calceolata.AAC.18
MAACRKETPPQWGIQIEHTTGTFQTCTAPAEPPPHLCSRALPRVTKGPATAHSKGGCWASSSSPQSTCPPIGSAPLVHSFVPQQT